MAKIDLGKITFTWKGTWDALVTYADRDVVAYTEDGELSSYVCTVATSLDETPNTAGTIHASWNYVAKGVVDPLTNVPVGSAGTALITDGLDPVTWYWGNPGVKWTEISTSTAAVASTSYMVDTSTTALTLTLPANPTLGDRIQVLDTFGTFGTNNLTIAGNGRKIQRVSEDLLGDLDGASIVLTFHNIDNGWLVT